MKHVSRTHTCWRSVSAHRLLSAMVLLAVAGVTSSSLGVGRPAGPERRAGADARLIVGAQECGECHEEEFRAWHTSHHQAGSDQLTRHPKTRSIAKALGIRRIKTDARCASCHFTLQLEEGGKERAISGVSCESCHGGARPWIDLHDDFGGEDATAESESAEHRLERLRACGEAGMRHPDKLADIARSCYECHLIVDAELLAAGHPTGEEFELVRWSQGEVRHNFVQGAGANPEASLERRRVMYVVGRLLALEFAVRAADQGGEEARRRLALASSELATVQEGLGEDLLAEAIALALEPSSLSSTATADAIHDIAVRFEETRDGTGLASIDAMLPTTATYVGPVPD